MAETPVGTSVPKWRGSKFVKTNMTNDMVCTLAKVKESSFNNEPIRFSESI